MSEPARNLPAELRHFLEQPRVAVLATVRRDGTPASTACWYELQDDRVLITMPPPPAGWPISAALHTWR